MNKLLKIMILVLSLALLACAFVGVVSAEETEEDGTEASSTIKYALGDGIVKEATPEAFFGVFSTISGKTIQLHSDAEVVFPDKVETNSKTIFSVSNGTLDLNGHTIIFNTPAKEDKNGVITTPYGIYISGTLNIVGSGAINLSRSMLNPARTGNLVIKGTSPENPITINFNPATQHSLVHSNGGNKVEFENVVINKLGSTASPAIIQSDGRSDGTGDSYRSGKVLFKNVIVNNIGSEDIVPSKTIVKASGGVPYVEFVDCVINDQSDATFNFTNINTSIEFKNNPAGGVLNVINSKITQTNDKGYILLESVTTATKTINAKFHSGTELKAEKAIAKVGASTKFEVEFGTDDLSALPTVLDVTSVANILEGDVSKIVISGGVKLPFASIEGAVMKNGYKFNQRTDETTGTVYYISGRPDGSILVNFYDGDNFFAKAYMVWGEEINLDYSAIGTIDGNGLFTGACGWDLEALPSSQAELDPKNIDSTVVEGEDIVVKISAVYGEPYTALFVIYNDNGTVQTFGLDAKDFALKAGTITTGDTLKFFKDFKYSTYINDNGASAKVPGITITSKDVTIDLNGCKIYNETANNALLYIGNSSRVTLTSSKAGAEYHGYAPKPNSTNSAYKAGGIPMIYMTGTTGYCELTINAKDIRGNDTISVYGTGAVELKGNREPNANPVITLTVNGGKYHRNTNDCFPLFCAGTDVKSDVVIKDATLINVISGSALYSHYNGNVNYVLENCLILSNQKDPAPIGQIYDDTANMTVTLKNCTTNMQMNLVKHTSAAGDVLGKITLVGRNYFQGIAPAAQRYVYIQATESSLPVAAELGRNVAYCNLDKIGNFSATVPVLKIPDTAVAEGDLKYAYIYPYGTTEDQLREDDGTLSSNYVIGTLSCATYLTDDEVADINWVGADGRLLATDKYVIGGVILDVYSGSVPAVSPAGKIYTMKVDEDPFALARGAVVEGDYYYNATYTRQIKDAVKALQSKMTIELHKTLDVLVLIEKSEYSKYLYVNGELASDAWETYVDKDNKEYYVFRGVNTIIEADKTVRLSVTYKQDGAEHSVNYSASALGYCANALVDTSVSYKEKTFVKYLCDYIKAAYEFVGWDIPDAMPKYTGVPGYDYTEDDEADTTALAGLFSVRVELNSTPTFVIRSLAYTGKVTIDGEEYTVAVGDEVVLDGINACDFADMITIEAGDKVGTYNLAKYVADCVEADGDNELLVELLESLYNYVKAAENF